MEGAIAWFTRHWVTFVAIVALGLAIWLITGSAGFAAIVALTALIAFVAWVFHDNPYSERSQGLAGAVSVIALLLGAYWYLVDRPGVPKLDISIDGETIAAGEGRALVFLTVTVANVGGSAIRFEPAGDGSGQAADAAGTPDTAVPWEERDCAPLPENEPPVGAVDDVMKVRLGKVAPLSEQMESRLACATLAEAGDTVSLARADLWPPVAGIDEALNATIEAGEQERYYFRALVPCEEGLTLSASVRIPKRTTVTDALFGQRQEGMVWIAQSVFAAGEACQT